MGWRTVTILNEDTLQLIAARHLGMAARWVEIALLNDLKPPYLAENAGAGVLAYGNDILLPIPQPESIAEPEDRFLTDIAIDGNGFIMTDGADIGTVSGEQNLRQALTIRAVTSRGSLLYHPEYGSLAFTLIGHVNSLSLADLAAFYTKSAIIEDPRVDSVESIKAVVQADKTLLSATVNPLYGEAIAFEAVL